MTDFTGAQVMAVRKSMKLSREKFAALVGEPMTAAKLHNIENEKRAIRPEERDLLRPHMQGVSISTSTTVTSSPPLGIFHEPYMALLDEDAETIWLDDGGWEVVADVPVREAPTPTTAAEVIDYLSPSSTGARAVLQGVIDRESKPEEPTTEVKVEDPSLIGIKGLYHDGLRRVSNSELQTFKHCRRKWWLGYYRGLTPARQSQSGPLALGTRIHESLAAYYVPGWKGVDPQQALEDLLLRDEAKLIQQLASDDAETAAPLLIDFKKEADLARAMLEGYVQWLAETGADQGYSVIAPERTLTTVIETPTDAADIELSGSVDVLLQRTSDNVILFIDHKTTGSFNKLTRMLVWDEQMQQYHLLAEANRPEGSPMVDGALYNMLRKVKRTDTAKPPFYDRVEVRHNSHQLNNFRNRLIGESLQIQQVEQALKQGVHHQFVAYPSPSDRCLWGCAYASVCPMFDDNSRAEDFIEEHYVAINPMRRYDDKERDTETP